jgi:glycerol-3-phosphate dehydrogenase
MNKYHALIVGGGGTGAAVAHDLALRGLQVTLVDRGEVTSGTTGRHHGMLHSGGRYAVKDQESARECIEENRILRKIAPGLIEENGGLFVGINDEDVEYGHTLIEGCAECGIPTRRLTPEEAFRLEPNLNPDTKMALMVPDGSFDAMRLPLRFFATAKKNGAVIKPYTEVIEVLKSGDTVTGVKVLDHRDLQEYEITADIIINAAGPWSGKVAEMVGVEVPVRPSPGVMLAVRGRLCHRVINRMTRSGDGDIIVPQRGLSIVGTSSWLVDDPDNLGLPKEHIEAMWENGSKTIPAVRHAEFRAAWSAARPLIGPRKGADTGRELSRTFKCFDHADEGVEGFVTITGGKATTLRGMAEACANVVVEKLGVEAPCQTRDTVLLPHTAYYEL